MGVGIFETLFVILTLTSGGLGVPLGMPPAPEDPMLGRFVAEDAQMYFAWTGVEAPEGNDPTSKWMAKPEIQTAITKFKKGLEQRLGARANRKKEMPLLNHLAIKTMEMSLYNGASLYAIDLNFDRRSTEFEGAILIPLGDQKMELEQLVIELESIVAKAESPQCEIIQKDGLTRFRIEQKMPIPVEFVIKDGYLVVGMGEGRLDEGLKNMQTEPPAWFTEYRKRLKVKNFSSMAYLSGTILNSVDLPTKDFIDLKSLTAVCFVSGLDDEGALSRAAVDLKADSNLEKLLPREPLQQHELARMPQRPLLGLQSRVPVDAVVDYIANVGRRLGDDPVADAEEQVEEMFGLSLREEMLNVFDGFASVSVNVDLAANRPEVIVALGISDEMSFPAVYETVVDTVSQWPEVADRLETSEHRDFQIYEFSPARMFLPVELCWAHANDQLIFATHVDLVTQQIDRMIDGNTFAETNRAKQLVEFGKQNSYGNPVAVTTLDPVELLELIFQFAAMWGGIDDDEELLPGFTFGDIPDLEVLGDGVDSGTNGVYRTPRGFEVFGRQTLPGSSPPVTLMLVGGLTYTKSSGVLEPPESKLKNSLRQILLACLNFESAHQAFPAVATKDADGKALLSWRVHILPYIEQNELYEQFHLDEPWDSEHNETLIAKMPAIYCHPDMESSDGKTVFLGVAGEGGLLGTPQDNAPGEVGFGDIVDGSSNTVLAVAVEPSSSVIWSKPEDLDVGDGGEKVVEATDENEDGTHIGFGDGSVIVVEDVEAERWENLMNISDGQVIDREALVK